MALSADQRRNAATIISVGRQLGASSRDILIALMAALVESGLRSGLTEARSDRDSAGLFQQRRAWAPGGSQSYRLNPVNAARMFFTGGAGGQRGLFDFRNRDSYSLGATAQRVQVSAFPTRYAKQEGLARSLLGGGAGTGGGVHTGGGGFIRPVRSGRITSEYGAPRPGRRHAGVDFGVPVGTSVYAAAAGRVVRVTTGGNYGTRIEMSHEGKLYTLYAHLSATNVRVGQQIMAGQVIGRSGGRRGAPGAGNSRGPHLHFEFRQGANQYRNTVNPMRFLNSSTTPNAYIDRTTVVGLDMRKLDPTQLMAEVTGTSTAPYVYLNPVDIMTEPMMPLGGLDPLAGFGLMEPLAEKPEEEPVTELNPLAPPVLEGAL